jgi:serine/threonine protein kinase
MADDASRTERVVGRYVLCDEIAAGGMATVHIGRLLGPVGFARIVAIKRLHPHYAKDPEFVAMLLDEARLAARIRHPNVVPTLDIVVEKGELLVVMEYVQGESLSRLARATFRKKEKIPLPIMMTIAAGALYGLHAAHEATSERGAPLCVVHRDVSPQNIMVGLDGATRVLDFGVARAVGRIQTTRDGTVKGKLAYMSPEQVRGQPLDRRSDLYAMAVVLWEMTAGRRLFGADNEAEVINKVLTAEVKPPSAITPGLPKRLDDFVMKGLRRNPDERFASALEMAEEVQKIGAATPGEVGAWVAQAGGEAIAARGHRVTRIESSSYAGGVAPLELGMTSPPPGAEVSSPSEKEEASGTGSAESRKSVVPIAGPSKAVARSVPLAAGLAILGGTLFVSALVIAALSIRLRAEGPSAALVDVTSAAAVSIPAASDSTLVPPPAVVSASRGSPSAPQPSSTSVARPTTTRPPPPRPGKCSPPYTVDENGIRTPKPECL